MAAKLALGPRWTLLYYDLRDDYVLRDEQNNVEHVVWQGSGDPRQIARQVNNVVSFDGPRVEPEDITKLRELTVRQQSLCTFAGKEVARVEYEPASDTFELYDSADVRIAVLTQQMMLTLPVSQLGGLLSGQHRTAHTAGHRGASQGAHPSAGGANAPPAGHAALAALYGATNARRASKNAGLAQLTAQQVLQQQAYASASLAAQAAQLGFGPMAHAAFGHGAGSGLGLGGALQQAQSAANLMPILTQAQMQIAAQMRQANGLRSVHPGAAVRVPHEGIIAGELTGHRLWLSDGLTLRSVYIGTPWTPFEPMKGDPRTWGVHSYKADGHLRTEYANTLNDTNIARVVGRCALWGEVTEHELGYRAEYARVTHLDEFINLPTQAHALLRARYLSDVSALPARVVKEYARELDTAIQSAVRGDHRECGFVLRPHNYTDELSSKGFHNIRLRLEPKPDGGFVMTPFTPKYDALLHDWANEQDEEPRS